MPSTPRCPTCGTPVRWEGNPDRPFCSNRCRVVDLGSWADERFRVPGEPVGDDQTDGGENGAANKKGGPPSGG